MSNRILRHDRRIISKKTIANSNLKPGMMVSFSYPGMFRDKNPLV